MILTEGVTPVASPFPARRLAQAMQRKIETMPQIEPPVAHFICEGIYARPMLLNPGNCVIGKIHTHGQINNCSLGDMSVLTHEGWKRVTAGFHMIAPAGSQRAFYAHAESIWTVFLRTDLMSIEEIEAEFVVETEIEYQAFLERVKS